MFGAPTDWLIAWWTLWALQAAWCLYNVNLFGRRLGKREATARVAAERELGWPAAVIVPVKGAGEGLGAFVEGLLAQDYPDYRVIFTVESEADPAYAALAAMADGAARPMEVVVAGPASEGGQKVHNQLAAMARLSERDLIIAFADADAAPDRQWLRTLLRPLYKGAVGASTGYRWFIPADGALPSRLASVINSSVATLQGPDRRNFAWGGSMAIRRDAMRAIDLAEHWRGALSDDYQMTHAVSRAGRRLYFVMRLLVPSPARYAWGELFHFGRRQYLITRTHAPVIWAIGLLGGVLYVGGWVTALLALSMQWPGRGWAIAAMTGVYGLDFVRGLCRKRIARRVFDAATFAALRPALRLDRYATPLVMAVHLLIVLSSAWGRTIRWAGVTYRIRGRRRVEIISR